MNIIQKLVANHYNGRNGYKPELIVIHVMDGSLAGTDSWFASGSAAAGNPVSAHYGIGLSGEIHQYVEEVNGAWHAGRIQNPTFKLFKGAGINPNFYTIGIEHEGHADTVWTSAMKASSAALIKDICTRWNIPIDRDHIIGHYQVFAGKPNCPAINKSIIDELIALAQPPVVPPTPPVIVPDPLPVYVVNPTPPATTHALFLAEKLLPYGPLIPNLSPFLNLSSASVNPPTACEVNANSLFL